MYLSSFPSSALANQCQSTFPSRGRLISLHKPKGFPSGGSWLRSRLMRGHRQRTRSAQIKNPTQLSLYGTKIPRYHPNFPQSAKASVDSFSCSVTGAPGCDYSPFVFPTALTGELRSRAQQAALSRRQLSLAMDDRSYFPAQRVCV